MNKHQMTRLSWPALYFIGLLGFPSLAEAQDSLSTGDTAWILTSTALVLFMTIPALALFCSGLVRTKNVLSIMMQCLVLTAAMSVLWVAVGYSLAFSEGNAIIGSVFDKILMMGIGPDSLTGCIPEVLFAAFQMTFAVITPALIVGAFVERMRFSAMLMFSALWLLMVYAPICHMTWGGGLFAQWGVLDFAGGIVVHITAGVAAHVHREPCRTGGGAHYKIDDSIATEIRENEIWPMFMADAAGNATGTDVAMGHLARPEAQSIVIHDPSDKARLACADLD